MMFAVFGATGGTGRELLKQALEMGHLVTACVRDPSKIKESTHADLKVIQGDVLDRKTVEETVAAQDAVLSALGAGARKTSLREDGTRVIVEAMENLGVKRFISLSSLGVGDSRENLGFFTKHIVVDILLRYAIADHERQESVVRASGLDWTIVRPGQLTDGPRTGVYQHGFPEGFRGIKTRISRTDVAEFMLKQVSDARYLRECPGISY
jgi:putative NADH-flavin reductase